MWLNEEDAVVWEKGVAINYPLDWEKGQAEDEVYKKRQSSASITKKKMIGTWSWTGENFLKQFDFTLDFSLQEVLFLDNLLIKPVIKLSQLSR